MLYNRVFVAMGVLALVLSYSPVKSATIDNFSGSLGVSVPALGGNPSAVPGGASASGAIGGARAVTLTRTSGTGSPVANIDLGGNGLFQLSTGPDDIATAFLQYDGDTNPSALNATGLGGINFTTGGTDSIGLGYRADLAGASIDLTIYSDATHASHASFNTAATGFGAAPFTLVDLLYSSFTPTIGTGADFANVGAVEIRINGTGVSALDLQLAPVNTMISPEPASLSLIVCGMLLARRRRR